MKVLEGRVAVITGAGRGIGRAVAEAFAREGADLVINDLGTEADGSGADPAVAGALTEELVREGARAVTNTADVSTSAGASDVVRTAMTAFGKLDTLVCCAGFLRDGLLGRTDEQAFDAVHGVHARSTFHCIRAAAEHMKRAGGGRIVTTTSIAGFLGNYGQSSYSAAAAAVYGLTRTASIELQRHAIAVNAVAPLAKTRLTRDLPMFEHVDSMRAEHAAPAYVFFGSELSGDLSGNVLAVAGGKLSMYRMAESFGKLKEADDGVWTAEEIQAHWEVLQRDRP